MAEYIEREALLHEMKMDIRPPFAVVRDFPAADVSPVVRCKDCSHCSIEGSLYLCALWNHLTELDDFCSDGKEVRNNERVDQR